MSDTGSAIVNTGASLLGRFGRWAWGIFLIIFFSAVFIRKCGGDETAEEVKEDSIHGIDDAFDMGEAFVKRAQKASKNVKPKRERRDRKEYE